MALSIFLLIPVQSMAQRDTTGTAAKTDSIIEKLTPLEYAFMMQEETKALLRVPLVGIGAEVEVLPYFTIMGQLRVGYNSSWDEVYLNLNTQMRWYYGSRKLGIRNMSGNYVAAGATIPSLINSDYDDYFYYGRWGVQRRFMDLGLIDFGVNVGYLNSGRKDRYNRMRYQQGILIQTTTQIGLGIVFENQKELDLKKLCPAVKCNEKERFLFKINMSNPFSYYYLPASNSGEVATSSAYRLSIKPQFALEQKFFDSPFSIAATVKLEYAWQTPGDAWAYENYNSEGYLTTRIQSRYYYNLKNRISQGKCGNGLSANYISGGYYKEFYIQNRDSEHDFTTYFEGIVLSTGVQRTFGNHFYFDVEFGGGWSIKPASESFILYGDMQLGLKF